MSRIPDLLTATEVADLLRVSRSTVSRWAQTGVLDGIRIGSMWRFRREDVEELLARHEAVS